ncbi:1-phosphatidylinositol 4-kinase [Malassezia caprae]|uniref:1-phosphatidylinositol 4-kinase n=1 Tax=Malassezia caprae TaxID=1381934 RepID=A0AAF0IV25_9BASI|nr:1-phosphatidylinositol 4-kinase [Malassezia caprae]
MPGGTSEAVRQGVAAPRTPISTIDLTLDDDDDEPILVETRVVPTSSSSSGPLTHANQPSSSQTTLSEKREDWDLFTPVLSTTKPWVCLGLIYPSVLCMYGVPPELRLEDPDDLPPVDPAWTHNAFWGEKGFRPVCIHASLSAAQRSTPMSHFIKTQQRLDMVVSTLQPGRESAQPTILNEYGRVTEKFSKILAPFMQSRTVHCVSRAKLVNKLKARVFSQYIETLVFVRTEQVANVSEALVQEDILLEIPSDYRPSDFPDAPPLYVPEVHRQGTEDVDDSPAAISPQRMKRFHSMIPAVTSREHLQEESGTSSVDALYKVLQTHEPLTETEPSPLIRTPLFSHQKQALTFLLGRERERHWDELLQPDAPEHLSLWVSEKSHENQIDVFRNMVSGVKRRSKPQLCRGAILADDMGLGKTLTTISLVASTFDEAQRFGSSPLEQDMDDDEPMLIGDSRNRRSAEQARREELRCRSRATLLVCPLTVIANWETQIREHWRVDQQPNVYIYHGSGRVTDPHMLADHDVVLTTYSTLGNEFSHQTTWIAAAGRADDEEMSESKRPRVEAPNTCQRIEWFRVVLDEAHIIKEARTWQAKAVCNLSASRRLCLTGTPIQNRIDDLYALVSFLRLDPFMDRAVWSRFCGDRRYLGLNSRSSGVDIDPESLTRVQTIMKFLTLRRMKTDAKPDGTPLLVLPPKTTRIVTLDFREDELTKYKELHSQFRDEFNVYVAKGTVGQNYATILHEILLLRMMCDHAELVDESMQQQQQEPYEMADLSETIRRYGLNTARALTLFRTWASSAMATCSMCAYDLSQDDRDPARAPVVTRCEHIVCSACFQAHMGTPQWHTRRQGTCPCCHTELELDTDVVKLSSETMQPRMPEEPTLELTPRQIFHPDDPGTWPPSWSTKIRALISDLLPFSRCNMYSELYDAKAPILDHCAVTKGDKEPHVDVCTCDPSAKRPLPIKSVIFSQWTRMLQRVGHALMHAGIQYRQLDGSMSRGERESAMADFRDEPRVEILLISLRAGGFGLNLVSGCRAYLLDPYWNPAVEQQGLDRIHRMGQLRPVIMTKFVMHQSIEEKLLALQERKMELANSVGQPTEDRRQARTKELQLLLS